MLNRSILRIVREDFHRVQELAIHRKKNVAREARGQGAGTCWTQQRDRRKCTGSGKGEVTWEQSGLRVGCVGTAVRKDKAELELNLSRDPQSNGKGFYRLKVRDAKPLSRVLEMSWQSGEVPVTGKREILWDGGCWELWPASLQSCLTNPMLFSDGVTPSVEGCRWHLPGLL